MSIQISRDDNERIHIVYVSNDESGQYGKYEAASVYSALCNTAYKIHLHVLTDRTLADSAKKEIDRIAAEFGALVSYYDVNLNEKFYGLPSIEIFSIGTLYRLYIDQFINASKVIYLDGDTLVNMDISNLWNMDMDGNVIMACQDEGFARGWAEYAFFDDGVYSKESYFNAGVFVLDLCKYRKEYKSLEEEAIGFFQKYPTCKYLDQDVLNYLFRDKVKFLPRNYNAYIAGERTDGIDEVKEYIYHSASELGRIKYNKRDCFDDLFWHYFGRTKWGTGVELEKFYQDKLLKKQELLEWTLNAYHKISKGSLVFWGTSGALHDIIKSKFSVDNSRDIYVDNNVLMWGNSKDGMRICAPHQLKEMDFPFSIIVLSKNYKPICKQLLALDFRENVDFYDGSKFLKEDEGGYPEWNIL